MGILKTLFSTQVLRRFWLPAALLSAAASFVGSRLTLQGWQLIGMILGGCVLAFWLGIVWADAYCSPVGRFRKPLDDQMDDDGTAGVRSPLTIGPAPRAASERKNIPLED